MTHVKVIGVLLLVALCGFVAKRMGYDFIDGFIVSVVIGWIYGMLYIAFD